MVLFALSFLPFVLAPFLVESIRKRPYLHCSLDGFVFVSVGGIICFHILPDSVSQGGFFAAGAAVLGLIFAFLFEDRIDTKERMSLTATTIALIGLSIHGAMDGIALAAFNAHAENGAFLALAVVIHRIPESLAVFGIARAVSGMKGALAALGILATFSAAGFAISMFRREIFDHSLWPILQAFLFGFLIHVLLKHSFKKQRSDMPTKALRWASFLGIVLATGLLVGIEYLDQRIHSESKRDGSASQTILIQAKTSKDSSSRF
jgi:zinc transporter ZupT